MTNEQVLYPLAIGGAGLLIYLLIPKKGQVVSVNVPSAASSGLPQYTPTVQNYDFSLPTLPPSVPVSLPPPNVTVPNYGSGGGCGCESCISDCQTSQSRFVDGHGGCMASGATQQLGGVTSSQVNSYAAQLSRAMDTSGFRNLPDFGYPTNGPPGWTPNFAF